MFSTRSNPTTPSAPWGMSRMSPLRNAEPSPWRYEGLDHESRTGRRVGGDGIMTPVELGKHGTSVNTYPPTDLAYGAFGFAVSRDGRWWFLECDPNGQWAWLEASTGLPLTHAIADLLEQGEEQR